MNDVTENGPAWESGVRPGDVIVTINDWLIVLMDRPQVLYLSNTNSGCCSPCVNFKKSCFVY